MIHFEKLRYKNFLSTGNNFTEIDFEKAPTTLVVGQNGAGKSTMLDALSFGLFGKPHRKISKMQLVNSVNQKGSVVEVEFRIGKKQFKLVRTIKPNKFEVWIDGNMANQNSHVTDYQAMLEKNIFRNLPIFYLNSFDGYTTQYDNYFYKNGLSRMWQLLVLKNEFKGFFSNLTKTREILKILKESSEKL